MVNSLKKSLGGIKIRVRNPQTFLADNLVFFFGNSNTFLYFAKYSNIVWEEFCLSRKKNAESLKKSLGGMKIRVRNPQTFLAAYLVFFLAIQALFCILHSKFEKILGEDENKSQEPPNFSCSLSCIFFWQFKHFFVFCKIFKHCLGRILSLPKKKMLKV